MSVIYIFNQYYIDFLRRIKSAAKENRDDDMNASILSNIKSKYQTLDKSSDIYLSYLNKIVTQESWDKFLDNSEDWFNENKSICLYEDIKLEDIEVLLKDNYLIYHFLSVFFIFTQDIDEELGKNVVKLLQTIDMKDVDTIDNEKIKRAILNIKEMRNKKVKDTTGLNMNGLEDTTLGKLAKEILDDVDISKLQASMGEDGNVLKAIGDPNSGFADIITNVSKKMASKISSGELKQENLIQDALKFASIMPNMFGGNNPMGNASGGGNNKMPDMMNMMNMMSAFMGNANSGNMSGGNSGVNGDNKSPDMGDMTEMFKNLSKNMKAPKGGKTQINEGMLKKIAKAKKLKKKLHERQREADNQSKEKDTQP